MSDVEAECRVDRHFNDSESTSDSGDSLPGSWPDGVDVDCWSEAEVWSTSLSLRLVEGSLWKAAESALPGNSRLLPLQTPGRFLLPRGTMLESILYCY